MDRDTVAERVALIWFDGVLLELSSFVCVIENDPVRVMFPGFVYEPVTVLGSTLETDGESDAVVVTDVDFVEDTSSDSVVDSVIDCDKDRERELEMSSVSDCDTLTVMVSDELYEVDLVWGCIAVIVKFCVPVRVKRCDLVRLSARLRDCDELREMRWLSVTAADKLPVVVMLPCDLVMETSSDRDAEGVGDGESDAEGVPGDFEPVESAVKEFDCDTSFENVTVGVGVMRCVRVLVPVGSVEDTDNDIVVDNDVVVVRVAET
jgi:hypothetical protein